MSHVLFNFFINGVNINTMGASASKATRAAGNAARTYPTRPPPTTSSPPTSTNATRPPPPAPNREPGPTVRPQAQATGTRDEAINLDASDPDFARSLRSLGPVQPNPTLSPSSAFSNPPSTQRATVPDPRSNPAIAVLDSRSKLQDAADAEFQQAGRRGHEGRQFLDIVMIRQIIVQRDHYGKSNAEIERRMGLKKGVVERLGKQSVIGLVSEEGRAEKTIEIV